MRDSLLTKNRGLSHVASYTRDEGRVLRGVRVGGKGSEYCSKIGGTILEVRKQRKGLYLVV
jgi:hypothetical protein